MESYGKKVWLIGDGYMSSKSVGTVSHESVCVLNTGCKDAALKITVYFEDTECMVLNAVCKAGRTHHVRLDKTADEKGNKIPTDKPYALLVESDQNVVVQHTRLDTSMGNMALMTSIAYPVETE